MERYDYAIFALLLLLVVLNIAALGYVAYRIDHLDAEQAQQRHVLQEMTGVIMAGLNYTKQESANGRYFSALELIQVYAKDHSPYDVLNTCLHETGHYIEHKFGDAAEYESIFNSSSVFVSNYARTDAGEDFAETFAQAEECRFNLSKVPEDRREYFERVQRLV